MKKIGIIGCGERIRGVVEYVRNEEPSIEVVALYDPSRASIEVTKKFFNIPDVKVYDRWEELVKDPDVDWVFIGSWNYVHARQTIGAFEAGKDVFCEKPICINLEECVELCKAQKKYKRQLIVGFTLRFSPYYRKIKEIIDKGLLGYIVSVEFNEILDFNHGGYIHGDWRRKCEYAGSHLLEKCCHDLDIANWFIGARAKRVASFGGCDFFVPKNLYLQERIGRNKDGALAFETWNRAPKDDEVSRKNPFTADKDIVDNQVAIIEFNNNVRATFHTNCSTSIPERRFLICGSEGTLRAGMVSGQIEFKRHGFDTELEIINIDVSGGHSGGDKVIGRDVADTMLHGKPPAATLTDGIVAAVTAFAIDESMYTGKVISLQPYWEALDVCKE